jgi:FAD synthetase
MTKVMAFGTFDILHNGHMFFLRSARKLGDELTVVIARDSTVQRTKGKLPYNSEDNRKKAVGHIAFVTKVVLGSEDDHFRVIWEEKPDIICLGYDQDSKDIEKEIEKKGLDITVTRLKSHKPEHFKSSFLKKRLNL